MIFLIQCQEYKMLKICNNEVMSRTYFQQDQRWSLKCDLDALFSTWLIIKKSSKFFGLRTLD